MDSEIAFFNITRKVFLQHGLDLPMALWSHDFLGNGLHTYQIAMKLGLNESTARAVARERDTLWKIRLESPVAEISGISAWIAHLNQAGHRMGVVTGAPRSHFDGLHRHTQLLHLFEFHITFDDCPKVKPLPDAYLLAAQRMGVAPQQCIAIEDSPRGVQAALQAGMRCALLVHALTDIKKCPPPTWTAHSVAELASIAQSEW